MKTEKIFGFLHLAKKTLAVLTASLSALMTHEVKALSDPSNMDDGNNNHNYESFQKRILKSKLVLKLNPSNPEQSFLAMHASHSSHASHASHASYTPPPGHYSHSSHSSHMSSSPSYTPSNTEPAYTPSNTEPAYKSKTPAYIPSTANDDNLTYYVLGSRTLYKGCEGTDVKELQQLLIKLGYRINATGTFGDGTYSAVIKFQQANSLAVDGIVGIATLSILKIQ
jgi:hypothetical protein